VGSEVCGLKKIKVVFVLTFLAIWAIPLSMQLILDTINDWIYVDLIFCVLLVNYWFWVYKCISSEVN